MREYRQAFFKQDFVMSYETTKSMEFEKRGTGEVIYLLMNKEITIVRDPDRVEDTENWKPVHNTSLRRFRKKNEPGTDAYILWIPGHIQQRRGIEYIPAEADPTA